MTGPKARRGRRGRAVGLSASKTLAVALVLFAMLCGLTLVVAQHPSLPAAEAAEIRGAIERIDRATNALEATNYGETRDHLRAAREALRQMIAEQAP